LGGKFAGAEAAAELVPDGAPAAIKRRAHNAAGTAPNEAFNMVRREKGMTDPFAKDKKVKARCLWCIP
jgi:hypothetical protein